MDQCEAHHGEHPKPNSDLLGNLGKGEPVGQRTILGPSPKANNDQDSYNHSSLRASAEALLLLYNARVGAAVNPMEHEKENQRTFEIPITAPIPLSYSVRGVEALRSILSVGEDLDELGEPMDFEEAQQPDVSSVRGTLNNPSDPLTHHTDQHLFTSSEEIQLEPMARLSNKAPVVIRPVSPETLMALTEPCLLAWCLDPMDETQEIVSTDTSTSGLEATPSFFVDGEFDTSYIMEPSNQNLWGY